MTRPFEAGVSRLARGGSGLVDLLVARRRVAGAHVERGADLIELEVVGLGAVLDQVELVLGVARVRDALDARTLIGVVALAGDGERLVDLAALGLLLAFLIDRGYGRYRRHSQHRQHR